MHLVSANKYIIFILIATMTIDNDHNPSKISSILVYLTSANSQIDKQKVNFIYANTLYVNKTWTHLRQPAMPQAMLCFENRCGNRKYFDFNGNFSYRQLRWPVTTGSVTWLGFGFVSDSDLTREMDLLPHEPVAKKRRLSS